MKRLATFVAVAAFLLVPVAGAQADPVTSGTHYDRNASIVQDGATTWMFFARSHDPCERPACDADNTMYDLYSAESGDGGVTWEAPILRASNPGPVTFRGRTVAATRRSDGTIDVFWANGGAGGALHAFTLSSDGASFDPMDAPTNDPLDIEYFNVEAVTKGQSLYLFVEASDGSGIYERTLKSGLWSEKHLLPGTAGMGIPKVMVGADGRFYMTMTNGDVYVSQSHDGEHWEQPVKAVAASGTVTNWDPSLAQDANGTFHLFYAPDDGSGTQRIASRTSTDFATWSTTETVLTQPSGYWDYWPEAIATSTGLRLFYTSEAPEGSGTAGTGHIWSLPITIASTTPPVQQPQQQQPAASQSESAPPDADRDGLPDIADCAPADAAKPARNGTDANCDGVVDEPKLVTLVLCSTGSAGADLLVCGRGKQSIDGLGGNDVISMGSGNDLVRAGAGDDLVLGQTGNDTLFGDAGDDSLDGGSGRDRLSGGAGTDALVGGSGGDSIVGGAGEDVFRAGDGNDTVNAADGKSGDVVSCGRGRDRATADRGDMVSKDCERVTIRRAAKKRR